MSKEILTKGIKKIKSLKSDPCYLVGGYIRNRLLGEENTDADIVSDEENLAEKFADSTGYAIFSLKGGCFKRVVTRGLSWDFTRLHGDIKTNLSRRDFRCDALALDIEKALAGDPNTYVIDPFRGAQDIKKKRITPVSQRIFKDDSVRIMRAFRLRSQIGFTFSDSLNKFIQRDRSLLAEAKGERLWQEMKKASIGCFPLTEFIQSDVAASIYPKTRGSREINKIKERIREFRKEEFLSDPVFIAALLWKDNKITKRLKFSTRETGIFKDYSLESTDLFSCWLARGREVERIFRARYLISGEMKYLKELDIAGEKVKKLSPRALLNGKEIMKILKMPASPRIGDIKKKLLKAQFSGRVETKEEAEQYIKNI